MSPTKTAGNGAKKNIPWGYHGMSNFTGGARNLLPLAYERPVPNTRTKGLKTGKNREFLQKMAFLGNLAQPTIEYTRSFLSICAIHASKFPAKIIGNFL